MDRFKRSCVWLSENKKGLFLWGIVLLVINAVFMGLNLQVLMWMMTIWPKQFGGAPFSLAASAVGALVTAAGALYTMYQRIADSEKNKTAVYDLDSKFNSAQGVMPPGKGKMNVKGDSGQPNKE